MAELQDHSCGCCVAWKRVYFGGMSAMADQYQITDPSRSKDEYCRFCNKICLTQNRIYLIKVLRRYLPRFHYVRNHDTNRKGAGFPAPPQTPLTWRQKQWRFRINVPFSHLWLRYISTTVEADLLLSAARRAGNLWLFKHYENFRRSFDSQLPVGQKTTTSRTICHYCLITMFHIIYDNIFKSIVFTKNI